jgi:hypothetical protein
MANYAHIENGQITGVYDLYPDNWRNISNFYLLVNESELIHNLGWRTIVKLSLPSYNSETQRLGNPFHAIVDDEVHEEVEVVNLPNTEVIAPVTQTEEEALATKAIYHNNAMEILRSKRDKLLAETDFTQLADVIKINGTELTLLYEEYRQALRDLPNSYSNDSDFVDEASVTYPTKPGVS